MKLKVRILFLFCSVTVGVLSWVVLFPRQFEYVGSAINEIFELKMKEVTPNQIQSTVEVKKVSVYYMNGEKGEISLPGPDCAKNCKEDEVKAATEFAEAFKKAGYESYPGFCCDSVCTGKIK